MIINMTQHPATPEQLEAGVFEPADKAQVQRLLTFDSIPSREEMQERARLLANIAKSYGCEAAMIGGAPFFMAPLEAALMAAGLKPLYAFSTREAVEEIQPDGSVKKTAVFKHAGWVETGLEIESIEEL